MRRIRLALAAAPLVLLAALGGCSSDDPEPRIDPAPSASDSVDPSGSGTPTVHSTPAPVALTPEETVRAWVDARNEALRTGDTSAMRLLTTANCVECANLLDPIEKVYANGGSFSTDGWKLVTGKVKSATSRSARFVAAMELAGGTTVESAGAEPVTYEVDKRIMRFRLTSLEGRWAISFIVFVS